MAPKSKSKQPPTTQQQQPKQQPPNWPALVPLIPPDSFHLNTLHPSQILTLSPFFPRSLCEKYVSFLRTLPLTTTPGKPKRGDAVRVNDRFQISDPLFAERLWTQTGLKDLVSNGAVDGEPLSLEAKTDLWGGEPLGLNPNIRIYRYTPGQFFDTHYDDSNTLTLPSQTSTTDSTESKPVQAKTTWTLLLYLTTCSGGETVFYPEAVGKRERAPEPVVAEPEVGLLLLHRHGRECLLHEGREVREGEKWVLRTDLCVRR